MTSRGKRKPRYGFDDIVMPQRLPRTGTRRQADNALLMAARGTQRPQPTVPRELRYARSYPKPDPSEIRPRLVRGGSGNRSMKFTRETSMRSRGAPSRARRGGGTGLLRRHANRIKRDGCRAVEGSVDLLDR